MLTEYMLKFDEGFKIYPIEVEAYYYEENFKDECVHQNELQKNRFGQLYFHRAGKRKDHSFLFDGGGIDICLSDDETFYLGFLIRSAWINNEDTPVCGPGRLTKNIVRHICNDDTINKITEKAKVDVNKIEDRTNIVVPASEDKRKKDSIIFNATRFGISPNKNFASCKLRSLIELKEPKHPYKDKEKVVLSYMEDNIDDIVKDYSEERIRNIVTGLLGYPSKDVIEKFKKKQIEFSSTGNNSYYDYK